MNNLFDTLSDYRQNELKGIFEEFTKKGEQIATDVINILTSKLPERTLLTVVIREKEETKFVGEIKDYVDLFAKGALDKKGIPEELTCTVCNTSKLISAYKETPLHSFLVKRRISLIIIAQQRDSHYAKVAILNCRKESSLFRILDYHISSVQGKKVTEAGINFWLIPSLNNYELLQAFKNDLGHKPLYYLNTLKELCKSLKSISTYDYEKRVVWDIICSRWHKFQAGRTVKFGIGQSLNNLKGDTDVIRIGMTSLVPNTKNEAGISKGGSFLVKNTL